MNIAQQKPRGRPRAFDERDVLEALQRTFWTNGYAASSLDELAAAAGVNRPSLYSAFGDKRAMYLAALDNYRKGLETQLASSLESDLPLRQAVASFLDSSIATFTADGTAARGCFAACTASSAALTDETIARALAETIGSMDRAFRSRVEVAQRDGEISEASSTEAIAQLLTSLVHGLAIRARSGQSQATLRFIAAETLAQIFGDGDSVRPPA